MNSCSKCTFSDFEYQKSVSVTTPSLFWGFALPPLRFHMTSFRKFPSTLRDADYQGSAVEIARMGLKRTGCILAAMFPLLYRARGTGEHSVEDDPFPTETRIGSIPSWVFDMHTRSGLAAFGRYRRISERMEAFLAEHADASVNLNRLVGNLVFRVESGQMRKRLVWDEGTRLRHAADLTQPGLPPEAVPEALSILRDEIDLLNQCRAQIRTCYL